MPVKLIIYSDNKLVNHKITRLFIDISKCDLKLYYNQIIDLKNIFFHLFCV